MFLRCPSTSSTELSCIELPSPSPAATAETHNDTLRMHLQKPREEDQGSNHVIEQWCTAVTAFLTDIEEQQQKHRESLSESIANCKLTTWQALEMIKETEEHWVKSMLQGANAGASALVKQWRSLETRLHEVYACEKEKYEVLSHLEPSLAIVSQTQHPLPVIATDLLPRTFIKIRAAVSASQSVYSTEDGVDSLLSLLSDLLVQRCARDLLSSSSSSLSGGVVVETLWEYTPRSELVSKFDSIIDILITFEHHCTDLLEDLLPSNTVTVPSTATALKQRCQKLKTFFTAVDRFQGFLQTHASHIAGVSSIIASFNALLSGGGGGGGGGATGSAESAAALKKATMSPIETALYKCEDFDRDILDFEVMVNDLELQLQKALRQAFDHAVSTQHALSLVYQHAALIPADVVRDEVDYMYRAAFKRFAADVEGVRELYESHKGNPPLPRGARPVSGAIQWSRSLLHRISEPIKEFKAYPKLFEENKKVVKLSNAVTQALLEYEMVMHSVWEKSAEASYQGVQSCILMQHPSSKRLHVNLDASVMAVLAEASALVRLQVNVPGRMRRALLTFDNLKSHHNAFQGAITKLSSCISRVPPPLLPLARQLESHFIDKYAKNGFYTVYWTSASLDTFITSFCEGIERVRDAVLRITDAHLNRIQNNAIEAISWVEFVVYDVQNPTTLENYVGMQMQQCQHALTRLAQQEEKALAACEDVVALLTAEAEKDGDRSGVSSMIEAYRRAVKDDMVARAVDAVKTKASQRLLEYYYSNNKDVLHCTRPFIRVEVAYDSSTATVVLKPSLEEIESHLVGIVESIHPGTTTSASCILIRSGNQSIKSMVDTLQRMVSSLPGGTMHTAKEVDDDVDATITCLQKELQSVPDTFVGNHLLLLELGAVKEVILVKLEAWRQLHTSTVSTAAHNRLVALQDTYQRLVGRLRRPIHTIEDVEAVIQALQDARDVLSDDASNHDHGTVGSSAGISSSALAEMKSELLHCINEASQALAGSQTTFIDDVLLSASALSQQSSSFRTQWETNGPMNDSLTPSEAAHRLDTFRTDFERTYKPQWEKLKAAESLFGLPPSSLPGLEKTKQEIELLQQLYSLYTSLASFLEQHGATGWLVVTASTATSAAFFDMMISSLQEYQIIMRKIPKTLRKWAAYEEIKKTLEDIATVLPLLQGLAHTAVKERHWRELFTICADSSGGGHDVLLPQDGLVVSHLLITANLSAHREEVEELCSTIIKEDALQKKLMALQKQWEEETFTFSDHKQRGTVVLKPTETAELMERLEESSMTMGGMSASRYAVPFRTQLKSLQGRLGAVAEALEQWLSVQSMWAYMEVVFTAGDIMRQLPEEAKKFQGIDRSFIAMVTEAREQLGGRVLNIICGSEGLMQQLPLLLEQLEMCQKSLSAYLENKRSEFPRFYFVSDPTLLEILSLGSDPASVVPHFQSGLFDSIANVTFDPEDPYKITEIWSREGERMELSEPVDARGPVEVWLQRLVNGMQETVRDLIRETAYEVREEGLELSEFVFNRPAQVALVGLQMLWTNETMAALQAVAREEKGALTRALRKSEARLRELVSLALRNDLTKIQRTSLETLITVHMHQKEATEELVRKRVKGPRDFEWLKQVRVTWRDDRDTLMISICDVDLEYSYEYLGVKERLVITPLTDVCYVTLTQALGMCLGGAPAGPAGTGKTETTKDLGATLGKYVVVFNCSDQMDHKGMGKIFKGLAQSGLWGCFDEFNRINLDVLSVCAQQVNSILSAVRERRKTFTFTDGSTVPLDSRVGFFITMNPGYAGRQELPENLKALFRGVTMMVPNRQTIIKVKLAAAGFQENEILAKKFHILYQLCEQQLSKQPHYDFGLRNILSVLRTAGTSKRGNPTMSETELMMRTLRDMNMSKFVAEDVPLFLALINDLFPVQESPEAPAEDVATALDRVCRERGLQPQPSWINKCLQLYETTLVRHGIMVVGPSGSGKSSSIECLAAALTDLGQKTVVWRMNPKAITAPQMFGRMDAATGDWTDGVFATLWRRAARAPKGQNTWIVLDGPVDAVWIENLNTVLDDNKVLTLANGDRVLMTPNMRLIFETENLNNASPATVSRAGIIFFSSFELGWSPIVDSWLQKRGEREAALLKPWCEAFVGPALEFIRLNCSPVMKIEPVCLVENLLTLLTGLLGNCTDSSLSQPSPGSSSRRNSVLSIATSEPKDPADKNKNSSTNNDEASNASPKSLYERHFIFCLMWSLGGLLSTADRQKFDAFLREVSTNLPPPSPSKDTIYEYYVDHETGEWTHWMQRVPQWSYGKKTQRFTQIIIPTVDSVRYEYLLSLAHAGNKGVLLVGGPGTAKTMLVNGYLSRHFEPEQHVSKTISFSSLTTPSIYQNFLEGWLEKRQGRTYGPPGNKKASLFLDDASMPAINQWGDQITNELARQIIEQGGWYSTDKPVGEWKQLTDVWCVAAMNLPGAGRNDIPNRLKRHFCVFYVPPPSEAVVKGMFGQLMSGHFSIDRGALASVADLASRLVPATMDVWEAAQQKLLPTPTKFHYSFTLKDLSKVFQGVVLLNNGDVTTCTTNTLVALWMHECRRVFADKLIIPEEKSWVDYTIQEVAVKYFSQEQAPGGGGSDGVLSTISNETLFANFLRDAPIDDATGEPSGPRPNCYQEAVGGLPHLRQRSETLVRTGKETSRPSDCPPDLVLFDDALRHLLRISRVLAMDRGSALLVGVGGSGKQSLARLAAFLTGSTCFRITVTKTYNISNLLEDLKTLYKTAALKPQPVTLILNESDIKDESFLEYINQVLSTGEVAGMFSREEMDAILADVRPVMKAVDPALQDTRDNLYSFFINRVRDRLHILLCFSPATPSFARWAQQFPSLITGCTIDWFLPWPQEALLSGTCVFYCAHGGCFFRLCPTPLYSLNTLSSWLQCLTSCWARPYRLQKRPLQSNN